MLFLYCVQLADATDDYLIVAGLYFLFESIDVCLVRTYMSPEYPAVYAAAQSTAIILWLVKDTFSERYYLIHLHHLLSIADCAY
jgi:hypothetical protein